MSEVIEPGPPARAGTLTTLPSRAHPARPRRRAAVSLSQPSTSNEPVEQLDWAVENIHRVNRVLPQAELDHDELIALGGLLAQISDALLTFTELLLPPAHRHDHTCAPSELPDPAQQQPDAVAVLQNCRRSYRTAHASARAFHATLKR